MNIGLPFRLWIALLLADVTAFSLVGVGLAMSNTVVVIVGAAVIASTTVAAVIGRNRPG